MTATTHYRLMVKGGREAATPERKAKRAGEASGSDSVETDMAGSALWPKATFPDQESEAVVGMNGRAWDRTSLLIDGFTSSR